jgi:T4 RnlA family RNA ligase
MLQLSKKHLTSFFNNKFDIMNLETLHKYKEDGLLMSQTHPTLPLTIWNYTQKVQYEGLWDEVTMACRGIITDDSTGEVLVRPFPKFFNYEEAVGKSMIPTKGDYVYIQEKMDGSLGILFCYEGEWVMATRGSFTSEQAIRGMEILKRNYPVFDKVWMKEYAYLVEIIYPENRIVVDYGKEKITFLSAVLNESYNWKPTDETELHWTTACSIFAGNGIKKSDIVKTEQHFNFSDELYKSLKEKNETNKEGFVLRFFPGNFRMKIKFEDYVRLHKVMTNLSTTAIWEVLSSGGTMDTLLADVPDEFYSKIKEYENSLRYSYMSIREHAGKLFDSLYESYDRELPNRKKYAEWVTGQTNFIQPILFRMYDKKDYSPCIWKLIKPDFKKI